MGRRFRRTLNVALAVATLLVVAVVVWFGVAVGDLGSNADSASSSGSGPLGTFTQARIMALELRADDELTLLTRDSIPTYQKDATATTARLHRLLATGGGTPAERALMRRARVEVAAAQAVHGKIRTLDQGGDLPGAVALASGTGPHDLPALSSTLDTTLAGGVAGAQSTFGSSMAAADGDLAPLGWGVALLLVAAAGLVVLGFRPRIAEYR
jgi:hypothetical protein